MNLLRTFPWLRRFLRSGSRVLKWTMLVGMSLWSMLAIYYSSFAGPGLRSGLTALFVVGLGAVLFRVRPQRKAHLICFAAIGAVLLWFWFTPASNDRDWQPDVAVLPQAEFNGDLVTIRNIRNCDYQTETNYTVHHYDKTVDLAKLRSVDFFVVYWGSPSIAHTMMSFGFEGGDYVCFSIETRKEKGESYSAVRGFFRQFELIYVIGDERDLVRLRSNYRGEQVFLYRLNTELASSRQVFLSYLRQVNRLRDRAQWYNAITANCTTMIRGHTKPYAKDAHFDWRILLNGRIDEMAYERRSLDQSLPFPELKARSLINDRAKAADKDPDFSRRIRESLPGMNRSPATSQSSAARAESKPRHV